MFLSETSPFFIPLISISPTPQAYHLEYITSVPLKMGH